VSFLETKLNTSKPVFISFSKIYGLNYSRIKYIMSCLGLSLNLKLYQVNDYFLFLLKSYFSSYYILGGRLRLWLQRQKEKYFDLRTFRGFRRSKGLTVRGQRNRTNAETARKLKK
jgi:ribosomal protein S13